MKKKAFVVLVSIAVALCAMGFTAPAAADEGPTGTPTPRPAPVVAPLPRGFAVFDAFIRFATSIVTPQKATSDGVPAQTAGPASADPAPTATPLREGYAPRPGCDRLANDGLRHAYRRASPFADRGRGLGRRQSMQSPLRFGEDLIDSAALDPTIVPRLPRAEPGAEMSEPGRAQNRRVGGPE